MGRAEDLFARISNLGEQAIDRSYSSASPRSSSWISSAPQTMARVTASLIATETNLAKAISGFGNSEGEIVIWGVDCRPNQQLGDVATAKVKIHNPRRFKSWLESAISGLTVPPHAGVRHVVVEDTSGIGFVIT